MSRAKGRVAIKADRKLKGLEDVSMIGVSQIENIVSVVEDTAKGNTVKMLGKAKALPRLDLPKVRKNRLVEIVPVSTGQNTLPFFVISTYRHQTLCSFCASQLAFTRLDQSAKGFSVRFNYSMALMKHL